MVAHCAGHRAIIGSGIFVLTGTAAAGEHFEAPHPARAVLDLIGNFCEQGARRRVDARASAAGPSIAISFCWLRSPAALRAVLCRTSLHDPIAGSATRIYATLGEIFAGHRLDLILEYVVSMLRSRSASADRKAQLAAFGVNLPTSGQSCVGVGKWTAPISMSGFSSSLS